MGKKATLGLTLLAALAFAAPASAEPAVALTDSTGTFTGEYTDVECTTDETTGEETCTEVQRTQQGYIGVYTDEPGVVACNGNPDPVGLSDVDPVVGGAVGDLIVGYAWVGSPSYKPATDRASVPFVPAAGFGRDDQRFAAGGGTEPTGNSPCPDADPSGANE